MDGIPSKKMNKNKISASVCVLVTVVAVQNSKPNIHVPDKSKAAVDFTITTGTTNKKEG